MSGVDGEPLAFSPDGRTIVTDAGQAVDVASGAVRDFAGRGAQQFARVSFSGDGRLMAASDTDGGVALWDRGLRRRVGYLGLDVAFAPGVYGRPEGSLVQLSPDGGTLAVTALGGGSVQWWDTTALRRLGDPLPLWGGVSDMSFTAGTKRFLITGSDQDSWSSDPLRIRVPVLLEQVSTDPERIAEEICAQIGRGLTREEWGTHIPNRSFVRVCP
ncbi:WD40 repeat domain-containing protein [Streptomyces sp. NPDC087440]|uniref:WD40 repeat domain-containing protein n=1 Tax=Streptomyces sp. NPDC087440 TaxID=3365790 RepID=UPI00382FF8B8